MSQDIVIEILDKNDHRKYDTLNYSSVNTVESIFQGGN